MDKFTNPSIKKEKKRLTRNVLISILLLIIAVALEVWGYYINENAKANSKPLNDIIVSKEENKEDKIATINAQSKPYLFAEEKEGTNGYHIVSDDKFMYIVYMSKYDELNNKENIATEPVEIQGVTKLISKDVKEFALKAYNTGLEPEEQLTMADFNSYFGEVYLDITETGTSDVAELQTLGGLLVGMFGIVMLVVTVVQKVKFSSGIKKMEETTIETLDDEMNSSDSFYYEAIHLYLTNHYIINFKGSFRVIEYQDIIWMYPMTYRTNGIKTNQSIKVMTKDGKTHEIAAIDVTTKARKEAYNEIWNTIVNKNNRIVLGYTKEAEEEAKSRIEL